MLGCGNSSTYYTLTEALSKDMLDDGYTHILSAWELTLERANRRP